MDIVFTGVGGQGVLFASELLSEAAIVNGLDVKKSEIHGMAQRGGSVISGVRIGKKIYAPTIEKADILCSFELIEAIRNVHILKPESKVFVNAQKIIPMTAFLGKVPYPDDPVAMLEKYTKNYKIINAIDIAKKIGKLNVVNAIMLGAVSTAIDFKPETWEKAIENYGKFIDINKKAFNAGREEASK